MAQPLQNITIAAPGFAGLNSQDSPIDLPPVFASVADNCIIDKFGRIGARKGYAVLTTDKDALGSSAGIKAIGQYYTDAGTSVVFSAGNNKILSGTTTLVDRTPAAYTITSDDWKMVNFNDRMYFFQRGYEPLVYNGTDVVKMTAVVAGTPPEGNEVLAAFGRLWCADFSTDKSTVYWSDLLNGSAWTGGSSGSIDLTNVWPNGYDEIVALASHNDFLIIFGKRSILVYSGASSPSTMVLQDTINGIGCIARDSVVYTGNDIFFLDDTGVRSLGRTIQEKSVPIGDISKNVRDALSSYVVGATSSTIKCHYNPENAFYLVAFTGQDHIYCFDTRRPLEDGSLRVTEWLSMGVLCFHRLISGELYLGTVDGVAEYKDYTDNGESYTLSWFSHPQAFGDSSTLKFLKKVNLVIIGESASTSTLNWGYGYGGNFSKQLFALSGSSNAAEYGVSEYNTTAEYSVSISISRPRINTSGSGNAVTVGVETIINGSSFSLQELNIHALMGRLV